MTLLLPKNTLTPNLTTFVNIIQPIDPFFFYCVLMILSHLKHYLNVNKIKFKTKPYNYQTKWTKCKFGKVSRLHVLKKCQNIFFK